MAESIDAKEFLDEEKAILAATIRDYNNILQSRAKLVSKSGQDHKRQLLNRLAKQSSIAASLSEHGNRSTRRYKICVRVPQRQPLKW